MSRTISDVFVEQLVQAGVQRIYGIVGDSLNPVVDVVTDCALPASANHL